MKKKAVSKLFNKGLKRVRQIDVPDRLKKMIIIPLIVFIGVLVTSGDYGLIRLFNLRGKIRDLNQDIKYLKVQAVDYQWEIDRLKNDPEYIKFIAAEYYGYAKADQTVIQFLPPIDTLQ